MQSLMGPTRSLPENNSNTAYDFTMAHSMIYKQVMAGHYLSLTTLVELVPYMSDPVRKIRKSSHCAFLNISTACIPGHIGIGRIPKRTAGTLLTIHASQRFRAH